MPSQKISEMPVASTLTGAELVPVVQGGTNKQTTAYNVSAVAMPTRLSELVNDVPYLKFGGAAPLGYKPAVLLHDSETLKSINLLQFDGSGNVGCQLIQALSAVVNTSLTLLSQLDRSILFMNGTDVSTLASLFVRIDETLVAAAAEFGGTLQAAGGNFDVDGAGVVQAAELHATDGFTGTGAYTNFEFIDGICVDAS